MADVEAFTGQAHALAQLMQWLSMPRVKLEPISCAASGAAGHE
jgi:hypothetical protein